MSTVYRRRCEERSELRLRSSFLLRAECEKMREISMVFALSDPSFFDKRLGGALCIASAFSVLLLGIRFFCAQQWTYAFLLWNLFLAWIPVMLSWIVAHVSRPRYGWKYASIPALLWLLFFPNAPYLLTDIGHLGQMNEWTGFPLGYDVVMLLAFTLNGLFLGFVSLFLIERVWREHLSPRWATTCSVFSLLLAGVGLYLGRFLRWNSWDLFHNPASLIRDIVIRLAYPADHPSMWVFTALYSAFLLVIYAVIRVWQPALSAENRER